MLTRGNFVMAQLETSVVAFPEAISGLTDEILTFLKEQQVDGQAAYNTALVVEELMTNLGTHSTRKDEPVTVVITVEPAVVKGEIIDTAEPFDPTLAADPDLEGSLEERPVGGLGLYLARQVSSLFEYTRRDGENWTTFAIARTHDAIEGNA